MAQHLLLCNGLCRTLVWTSKLFPICADAAAVVAGAVQGVASRKPSANKAEAAQQLLATYEAILAHLRAHGALVNAVKPEYLLEPVDFELLMEARSAAAAGNPEQEAAQELWGPVEQSFGEYSARAWNCVLLQVRGWCSRGRCRVLLLGKCGVTLCMQVNSTLAAAQSFL